MADQIYPKRQGGSLKKTFNKVVKSTEIELIKITRGIWNKEGKKAKSAMTEDQDFREFFCCGLNVASELWDLLVKENALPESGCYYHILWAFMPLKIYGKEKTLCTLAGGVDKKTFRKWSKEFVVVIGKLESSVVSHLLFLLDISDKIQLTSFVD